MSLRISGDLFYFFRPLVFFFPCVYLQKISIFGRTANILNLHYTSNRKTNASQHKYRGFNTVL